MTKPEFYTQTAINSVWLSTITAEVYGKIMDRVVDALREKRAMLSFSTTAFVNTMRRKTKKLQSMGWRVLIHPQ